MNGDGEPRKVEKHNLHDEYGYEENQQRMAMMKSYHHPMKQWFRQQPQLEAKYGAFPLFWQELNDWEPYREVLKAYIMYTENGEESNKTAAEACEDNEQNGNVIVEKGSAPATVDEQSRKRRKSRWGDPVEATAEESGERKRKKSRWASGPNTTIAGLFSQQQQQAVVLRAELDNINQKLRMVAMDAALIEKDPNRSPSPPPQYDSNGKRTNTREVRMREALEKRRCETIDELLKVNPLFRPPSDYSRQKLHRKIYIPIREFPSYNFIGLIIGPRGNTQKRMERETNCKIAIRGKGSVKEGSKGKKTTADENDDLHVLITGDREEDIERAAREVQSLLVPVDDTNNSHKQKQLRELALINGTLRDDDYCHICGEKGHRQWECPNRDAHRAFKAVNVKCALCGDSSHPTRDCTQKGKSAEENAAIDKEYQSFMQQLGETPLITSANGGGCGTSAASAPWLQPVKTSSAATTQSWMLQQSSGAPGTAGAPGVQAPGSVPLGSTPATAFPPPVVPTTGYHYQVQGQEWNAALHGWNGGYDSYYESWNTDYQSYGQSGATGGTTATPGTDVSNQHPYPSCAKPPPQ